MQMLPRVMPVFRQRYPHIKLEIKEAGSNITEKSVLNGDVDIAIMTTSPGNDELIYELVETEDVVLVANKLTMLAQRIDPGVPSILRKQRMKTLFPLQKGITSVRSRIPFFDVYDIKPHLVLETSSIEVGKRLVSTMDAVFICPDVYLDHYFMEQGDCVLYPLLALPISATAMSAREKTRT